jgi:hypothetical protein
MQSSLGVKTLLQDPALVARTKYYSGDTKPPVKKPRPLSGTTIKQTLQEYA